MLALYLPATFKLHWVPQHQHTAASLSQQTDRLCLLHAATESAPAGNPIANTLQRAARGVAGRAASLLQLKPGSKQGEEDSEDAEMRSSMRDAISRAETAMAQAEGILKQLDQAAEELFMKVGC